MLNYHARLHSVQSAMTDRRIDLLFLNRSANLRYLTGIPRDEPNFGNTIYPGEWLTGAWIPQSGAPILTLPRMLADFHMGNVTGYDVRVLGDADDPVGMVRNVLASLQIGPNGQVAVDDRAWAELVLNLRQLLPRVQLSLASDLLMPLRRIKDEDEIALLRKAGEITEAAFAATLPKLRHGMTNLDLISEVQFQLKKHGAKTDSFVTSFYNMGPSYPFDFHNREEVLQVPLDPPVAISYDMGGVYEGYCYDYGRSVYFGDPDAEYRRVHELVMSAQAAGIASLGVGNTCEAADSAARAVITEGGWGEGFRHRLGHAIGLDVHESPFLTQGDTTVLQEGMCFTVEPSIFMPHQFGCRVEDVVVVRPDGGEVLTNGYQELAVVA
ncbi:Xaa-Pro peptidase family protein [Chloroflexi bacterium TSY]|nr:Xaa-Pro peptidase family protein [Chloroflexi bacterium TSY]